MTNRGVYESLQTVDRSKFTGKKAFNGRQTKFIPYKMGLQVSYSMDTEISEEGVLWREIRRYLGGIIKELAQQKESMILEGHMISDHLHMLISIPPKYSVSQFAGGI